MVLNKFLDHNKYTTCCNQKPVTLSRMFLFTNSLEYGLVVWKCLFCFCLNHGLKLLQEIKTRKTGVFYILNDPSYKKNC